MNVLGFGAIVWDEIEGERNIGGAVFNLLAHVSKRGGAAYLVSAVGKDELGTETLQVVRSLAVLTRFIQNNKGVLDLSLVYRGKTYILAKAGDVRGIISPKGSQHCA